MGSRSTRRLESQIRDRREHVNVVCGFRGLPWRAMRLLLASGSRERITVIAERPTQHTTGTLRHLKGAASERYYRHAAAVLGQNVGAFLAMGEKGMAQYTRLGFTPDRMFPFMYAPYVLDSPSSQLIGSNRAVRFIYVGRLDARHKGLDILVKALSSLGSAPWELDVVGGYGDMLESVKNLAQRNARVNFLGKWPAPEVVARMTEYDVCIVPSTYDGWNTITNQAINAGLALIVTDEATSDELVTESGAGVIVKAGDDTALAAAMRNLAQNRNLVNEFKLRSRAFSDRISTPVVGQYLLDVLDYSRADFYHEGPRPECPWRKRAN